MKRILMLAVLIASMLSAFATGYNAKQEALRTGIENSLKGKGYSLERKDDGLMFMVDGDTYYIEIDESCTSPMYVRLARYIKFDDNFKRSEAMKKLRDYNSKLAVKAYCKEKNLILSTEMFVTEANQFTDVFNDLLSLLKSVSASINK